MVKTITKLARLLTTEEDKVAYVEAMEDMGLGHTIVPKCEQYRHQTACPEAQEVTKQSKALVLLSVEE
tara:strand:+ start:669 stop:872 length:204 start_codon:yes stop_codon:yes gene_type:complete